MLKDIMIIAPEKIEAESMRIIESEMDQKALDSFTAEELKVVKRCIHTSADFEYQTNLIFGNDAMNKAFEAFKKGAVIITDTKMALAGINKTSLQGLNCEARCFISDEDIIKEAKERGVTRACVSMERAFELSKNTDKAVILAVGNAPTALIRIYELIEQGFDPALIIGVPVGFVNVVESKNLILETKKPHIVAKGRKGGSNIAAAIINAIMYQLKRLD